MTRQLAIILVVFSVAVAGCERRDPGPNPDPPDPTPVVGVDRGIADALRSLADSPPADEAVFSERLREVIRSAVSEGIDEPIRGAMSAAFADGYSAEKARSVCLGLAGEFDG